MRPLEKTISAVVLIGGVTFAGYAFVTVKADADRERAEAAAAGFATYGDLKDARAAGISDPGAWTVYKRQQDQRRQADLERKQQEDAKAEAERARVAAARADMLAKSAARAEADRRELLRDPATKMKVGSFSWKKSGFGNVAVVTVAIENGNEFAVKDIGISCSFSAPSGTHLSNASHVIYETIKPNARRTFSDVNIGFIHSQARSASCQVDTAARL